MLRSSSGSQLRTSYSIQHLAAKATSLLRIRTPCLPVIRTEDVCARHSTRRPLRSGWPRLEILLLYLTTARQTCVSVIQLSEPRFTIC